MAEYDCEIGVVFKGFKSRTRNCTEELPGLVICPGTRCGKRNTTKLGTRLHMQIRLETWI